MYTAGWGKAEIAIEPQGYALWGYGHWQQRGYGKQTPLYARALFIGDPQQQGLIFCCLDMGCVTGAMRAAVCAALHARLGDGFNEAALVLTATHTHAAPGGCSHEALYEMPTPGFVPAHLAAVVTACVTAIMAAWQSAAPTELGLSSTQFAADVPVAWNRSLASYNRNPDVLQRNPRETHLAIDRSMGLLSFRRAGELQSLLSLFGVHATCLSSAQQRFDGDNKGYASAAAEQALAAAGVSDAVAIFAQATAGDVSPHDQGPGGLAKRKKLKGEAEYVYAAKNGNYQSERALGALSDPSSEVALSGEIDAILSYIDFTNIHADAVYAGGEPQAWTSEPCHGVSFFTSVRIDGYGTGLPLAAGRVIAQLASGVKAFHQSPLYRWTTEGQYYQRLYAAQGPKAIFMESGRKRVLGRKLAAGLPAGLDPSVAEFNRQLTSGAIKDSPLVPTRLPLQIVTIGQLALVCCPGEFTTMAGKRLLDTVKARLHQRGIEQVLICTYCNDYMGYVTTHEEYQQQAYEGGHTLFGQWTLAAFQTCFAGLADELLKPEPERSHDRLTRPVPVPRDELALRTDLGVPG